jgi:hypothetical protein
MCGERRPALRSLEWWRPALFEPFNFEGITSTGPTRTFSGKLSIDVGGREARLIQVGPATHPLTYWSTYRMQS